ncbi:MAG: hypothetical protein AB7F59_08360 [Bdellovibrionales bacterium]
MYFLLSFFTFFLVFPLWAAKEDSSKPAAQAPTGPVLSKTIGTVGDHVLTSREVQIYYFLEQALKNKPVDPTFGPDSSSFKNQISENLLEWMVYLEAKSFSAVEVSTKEKQEAEAQLAKAIRSSGEVAQFWRQLEVSVDQKNATIDRKLRAKKFLQFRGQSSFVTVTDREALNYFQKNRTKFGNMGFEKFKDQIKTYLSEQQADERMQEWLSVLQKKYNVRHLGLQESSSQDIKK